MFVNYKEGSTKQLEVRANSNIIFKEIQSDIFYVMKNRFEETVGDYVSLDDVIKTYSTKKNVSIMVDDGMCTNFETNTTESNRKLHGIGDGKYKVLYKEPHDNKCNKFIGICENFCSDGKSAFWDIENEQMLLIEYEDIIGLYPIKG